MITATHDLELVEDIAERIVVLEEGKETSGKWQADKRFSRTTSCCCAPIWCTPTATPTER